jgi:hypothetical protein
MKKKFKTPYISTQTESGTLSVPSSSCGQKKIPFFHERTEECKNDTSFSNSFLEVYI